MMRVLLLAFLVSFSFFTDTRAQGSLSDEDNYFVVIGAFSSPENANRLVWQSKKLKLSPMAELNIVRGLYYVYVLQTADKDKAVQEAMRVRSATPYAKAWVFEGRFRELKAKVSAPEPAVVAKVEVARIPESTPVKIDSMKENENKIKEAVKSKSMVLKKGETETLNFIYFFRDAAVLRPESRFEVERLVRILNDHPTENIRIHGHTNGNDKGKIIRLKDTSSDFFSLENTVEDFGSAVALSELRATLIMDYLASQGIAKNRMSIKAWGGKKPLYEVDDERAEANVRVEIEVLNYD